MPFTYNRIIHFQDTDAAGVVYFTNILSMCHEAYEASLLAANINLKTFFSNAAVAVPIVHADVDFLRPLYCGDEVQISLQPRLLGDSEFEVEYQVLGERLMAKAVTRHVCIGGDRKRLVLGDELVGWLRLWEGVDNELPSQ
ncbi:acyl-CoA thioesterase [Aliterella atlantica]|uniref:1,4-dihydroxy-2-naphthoyl-CoA hydrolase n=1 Tax=Aliterella atlantica CENA595 TaxID=1618023 RepID=A0A0D8ZRZ2_9CYAN|nr:acyl-CoA thioesterase [Aliterella atlantica]KJH69976.1 1,4-dihydroxy-2-naphthoyl-CoA hydrolase [Aliterella atlantica CENA595]